MILFNEKGPRGPMESTWTTTHPDLQGVLSDFDAHSVKEGLPTPVVTDLVRSSESQVRIYVTFWRKLQAALEPGPRQGQFQEPDGTWRPLLVSEMQTAKEVRGLTVEQLERKAAEKFTWHWVGCAADLRTHHYSRAQLAQAIHWFEYRCRRPQWEFLVHDVTAPHMHVGRRDFDWRTRWGAGV